MQVFSLLLLLVATISAKDSAKKKQARANYRPSHPPLANICQAFRQAPLAAQQSFDPARYLNSKSPYPIPSQQEQQVSRRGCPNCRLLHVASVTRHGTRNVGAKDIICWGTDLERMVQTAQLPQEYAWMRGFYNPLDISKAGELQQQGWQDLALLAQRDRQRYYPHMEGAGQDMDRFTVDATTSKRVQESARSYLNSLFGMNSMKPRVHIKEKNHEKELRPWDKCPRYDESMKKPIFKWRSKERDARFIQPIAQRLSNLFKTQVTKSAVMGIYSLCMSQRVLCGIKGQWCSLFTEQEFQVVEWVKDDAYYFKHGPGMKVNREMGANLLTAMLKELKDAFKRQSPRPSFSLRFGHAETIARLANVLGMFNQRPILGNRNRLMLLSRDIPFMANIKLEMWQRTPQNQQNGYQYGAQPQQYAPPQQWQQPIGFRLHRRQAWQSPVPVRSPVPTPNWSQGNPQWYQQAQQSPNPDWAFHPSYNKIQYNPQVATHFNPQATASTVYQEFQDWDEFKGGVDKHNYPNLYVRLLHNERPLIIPGCQDMYCPFDDVLHLFKHITKQDVRNICQAKF